MANLNKSVAIRIIIIKEIVTSRSLNKGAVLGTFTHLKMVFGTS
jgi:hypothetical protein